MEGLDDEEMEGLDAIIAVLPKLPNLSSLKCASSKVPFWPRSAGRATLGAVTPRLTFVFFGCSLDKNALCGIDEYGNGTYTTEGIVVLMEGVKNSKIQSLR